MTLQTLLSASKAGDTVTLPAGTYPFEYIKNLKFSPPVTIKGGPGVVSRGIRFQYSSGFVIDGLEVQIDPVQLVGIDVQGTSSNVVVNNCDIHGSKVGEGTAVAFKGAGCALTGNRMWNLAGGGTFAGCDGLTVSDNITHDISTDAYQFNRCSNVLIARNKGCDHYPPTGAHPDFIQFFTTGQTAGVSNIAIVDNEFRQGKGGKVQGLFMGNEANQPYSNVSVTGNRFLGTMYNGIAITKAVGLKVTGNYVQGFTDMNSWAMFIYCTGVTVTDNSLSALQYTAKDPATVEARNVVLKLAAVGDESGLNAWLAAKYPPPPGPAPTPAPAPTVDYQALYAAEVAAKAQLQGSYDSLVNMQASTVQQLTAAQAAEQAAQAEVARKQALLDNIAALASQ